METLAVRVDGCNPAGAAENVDRDLAINTPAIRMTVRDGRGLAATDTPPKPKPETLQTRILRRKS